MKSISSSSIFLLLNLQKTTKQISKILVCTCFLQVAFAFSSHSQNSIIVQIVEASSKKKLEGVSLYLPSSKVGALTDANGRAFVSGIKSSSELLIISLLGYETIAKTLDFSSKNQITLQFLLKPSNQSQSNVKVASTRNDNYIEQTPLNVQVIDLQEIENKFLQNPANLSQVFTSISGLDLQQTSGLSGNVQVRMQGLDGKYTQILKDGIPLFGGLGNAFALSQLSGQGLQQIEIIRGANGTLYGGDGMAGVINLVSKKPSKQVEKNAFLSQNLQGGTDLGGFYSGKLSDYLGLTLQAMANLQSGIDVDKDGIADIAKGQRFSINPKFFYEIDRRTHLDFGIDFVSDNRSGGLLGDATKTGFFSEKNNTNRTTTHLNFEMKDRNAGILTIKNGITFFNRNNTQNSRSFKGNQLGIYNEISYRYTPNKSHDWVFGGVYQSDNFKEESSKLDYFYRSFGAFIQDDWKINPQLSLQAGLRTDYVWRTYPLVRSRGQGYVMPRLSVLYKPYDAFTARLSGSTGYKNPTFFNDQTDRLGLWGVQALNNKLEAEQAYNLNADIAYTRTFGDIVASINQGFFVTQINNHLSLVGDAFVPATSPVKIAGFESNLYLKWHDFKAHLAYTYTHSNLNEMPLPFAPKNKTVLSFSYQKQGNFKVETELMMVGKQYLDNNQFGQSYGLINLNAEKQMGKYVLIATIRNLGNVRQSNWQNVAEANNQGLFVPIYAPLVGSILSVGARAKL